jgi:malonate-semialdehyde dehydrogenase (acetylating) / methylmalonate-semialdehyde dehydrogenase
MADELPHLIGGRRVVGRSGRFGEVRHPDSGALTAQVPFASRAEVAEAVANAAAAQPEWAAVNPQRRGRVLTTFARLVTDQIDDLAAMLSHEHGKTIADSKGDLQRGLELVDFAAGVPHLLKGEYSRGVGPGIDSYSVREPLGVVAGITPFNFPAMVPMWKFAPAVACGNAMVLKPSELVPSLPLRLAELMIEAGLPPGVLNVVNGDKEAVDALLEDPRVQAVGFVGSSAVAEYVYRQAGARGKRAQCFGSAKNHMIVMPDADLAEVADALVGAAFGTSGERCMAISVVVPVGAETGDRLIDELVPRLDKLRPGLSTDDDADFGPVVSGAALTRITGMIESGVAEGAQLVLDGRTVRRPEDGGYLLGPSLFDHARPEMDIYRSEIFGPVLTMVRAENYAEALALVNEHEFGNGATIYTGNGYVASDFVSRAVAGMVGVNVPIPAPVSYFTFGGWKRSSFGDLNQHGPDSIRFYTKTKTVTTRWRRPTGAAGPDFALPLAGS